MNGEFSRLSLETIFSEIKIGNFHVSSQLKRGEIPLISCKTEDHGVEGFFDISNDKTYENCVTIACDGQPLTTFFHPYRFAAKDNVLICIPRTDVKLTTILYAVACLNRERWRFSYGRKCYVNKKDKLTIPFPVDVNGHLDENSIKETLNIGEIKDFLPTKSKVALEPTLVKSFGHISITKLFELHTGDYHNASNLPRGNIPLISCGESDNGTVRYSSVPSERAYGNALTIAYNGQPLTTKYHPYRFAAKDDVAVCIPKRKLRVSTLVFLQYILNRQRWRYSYGRKCFKGKLSRLQLHVPLNDKNEIDEDVIEKIV